MLYFNTCSILYGKSSNARNENSFVFSLSGLNVEGKKMNYGNKAGWLFCTCLKINELAQTVFFLIFSNQKV